MSIKQVKTKVKAFGAAAWKKTKQLGQTAKKATYKTMRPPHPSPNRKKGTFDFPTSAPQSDQKRIAQACSPTDDGHWHAETGNLKTAITEIAPLRGLC